MNARKLIAIALFACLSLGCNSRKDTVIIECGGPGEFACPRGTFCDLGEQCGGFDAIGQCRRLRSECPNEKDPVCGCDNKTYLNSCYAHGSGVSIHYRGECIRKTVNKKAKKKNFSFPATDKKVDGSNIESAGDVVIDQWRPKQ